ncbi:hypothetical protein BH09VER1_BH09VER1_47370 [soil metagenome]
MKNSPWLAEFHRQWVRARGRSLCPPSRGFSRPWQDLLDAAGLHSAAERAQAQSEAEALAKQGHFTLKRHRYRTHNVESVTVPPGEESWLISLFGGSSAQEIRSQALAVVRRHQESRHPRWPESWLQLCDTILSAFAIGKNCLPFLWNDPAELDLLLTTLQGLTAREWPPQTMIRDASTALGLASKYLEKRRASLESALSVLFAEYTSIESLGIQDAQSHATVHGQLTLYFDDGTVQTFDNLHGEIAISVTDLKRATRAMTAARRILSIENAKTTFRQAIAANRDGETLLVATSHPNAATARLLEILPLELDHHHFGDTDVSGYSILRSLRARSPRPVRAFLMNWRDSESSSRLSEHDRRILPALIADPAMEDCRDWLQEMDDAGRKGNFEQESRGPAVLNDWPFWLQ